MRLKRAAQDGAPARATVTGRVFGLQRTGDFAGTYRDVGGVASDLGAALRRLREQSRLLPVTHPLFSRVYHSHPPLLERLRESRPRARIDLLAPVWVAPVFRRMPEVAGVIETVEAERKAGWL